MTSGSRTPPRSYGSSHGRGRRRSARTSGRSHPREGHGGTACLTNASESSSEGTGNTSDSWSAGGRSDDGRVRVISSRAADLTRAQVGAIGASWWFVTGTSFPDRPPDADVVRTSIASQSSTLPGGASQPYSYEPQALSGMARPRWPEDVVVAVPLRGAPVRDVASARAWRRRAAAAHDRRRPPSAHDHDEPVPRDHQHVHRLEGARGITVGRQVPLPVGAGDRLLGR